MKVETILNFVESRFPGYRQQVIPASEETIACLQEHAAKKLPDLYLDFLGVMGENCLDLSPPKRSLNGTEIADFLEVFGQTYERFALLALDRSDSGGVVEHTYFDFDRPTDGNDFQIVRFEDNGDPISDLDINPVYSSLKQFLSFWTFRNFSLSRRKHQRMLSFPLDKEEPSSLFAPCMQVAKQLGFQEALPGLDDCWTGELQYASIMICARPSPATRYSTRIGADSEVELARLCGVIEDHVSST